MQGHFFSRRSWPGLYRGHRRAAMPPPEWAYNQPSPFLFTRHCLAMRDAVRPDIEEDIRLCGSRI
jgi:hypothetical protein